MVAAHFYSLRALRTRHRSLQNIVAFLLRCGLDANREKSVFPVHERHGSQYRRPYSVHEQQMAAHSVGVYQA